MSRALFSFVLIACMAVIAGPAVAAQPVRTLAGEPHVSLASARTAASTAEILPVCDDRAYHLLGGRWSHAVHWRFKGSSTPEGMSASAVETVLARSFNNITNADNDCGRADRVSAQNVYEGRTRRSPGISRYAQCSGSDGRNVVGFGRLPPGVLAVTCTHHMGEKIVEADIRISSRYGWALTVANCDNQELLEPTLTHEVGHVYGLGHVSERRHPLMTMSTRSDGPCNNAASTLGLGDMLGLEALY